VGGNTINLIETVFCGDNIDVFEVVHQLNGFILIKMDKILRLINMIVKKQQNSLRQIGVVLGILL